MNAKVQEDLTGQKFGKLTPFERINQDGRTAWNCRCECGETRIVYHYKLKNGQAKNCVRCSKRNTPGTKSKGYRESIKAKEVRRKELNNNFLMKKLVG